MQIQSKSIFPQAPQAPQAHKAHQAFFFALLAGILIFLPFVIYDGGYFLYYGDFNVQQIPFYKLAHEAVRAGDIFWNWHTDLGVNFIGSYSFYLLFSPFFWLTLPFPTAWVPFLMAPLLVLKTACAALTAHLYLRRFVKDERMAVIGALLYAFSGWMAFNVFFNHFHEVAVFFPLLLLGVEKLVTEDKKGLLAGAVLANAVVNYWFFVGEAVFVVLYVLVRATDKSWGLRPGKFCRIAFEAVLGFACAALAVLPSVMALSGNPRTGTEELLTGWNAWLYWHEQRQPAIIQSLFFPPELPARPNFLPDHGAKWASLSGWLPLFALTGVLAYFFRRRDDWLKKLLALSLVFAMVPALNSAFILLNNSYYARWFYMPILLMALATVRALEDSEASTQDFSRAVKWSAIVLAAFILMCGVTPTVTDGELSFGLADKPFLMWIYSAIAMACLALSTLIGVRLRHSPHFRRMALAGVLCAAVGFQVFYMANGKSDRERSRWYIDHAINGRDAISLPDDGFARIDVYDGIDNLGMYWRQPTIQAFHSIVPPSLMEFYPAVGVERDVASRPEADNYALRPLLSVRWLFIEENKENQEPMPGYTYYDTQNTFRIYENDNFLPMGFGYDAYVTREQLEQVGETARTNLMLRGVVLDEDAIRRNSDILTPLGEEFLDNFSAETMAGDVEWMRQFTVDSLRIDRSGFTAATSFDEPRLLFFSVPWEGGWSARILGGETLTVEKANLGFVAVRAPAGSHTIRFDYETPGLTLGLAITGGALLVFGLYLLIGRRKQPDTAPDLAPLMEGKTIRLTWDEYIAIYHDKDARQAHLQRVLNEAAVRHIEAELPAEDRTLQFAEPAEPPEPPISAPAEPADGDIPEKSGDSDGEGAVPPQ